MIQSQNFTIVDIETTGGSPFFSRIIEVGLLKVEKGEVVEEYQTLLNPGQEIPEFVSKMTGITEKDVKGAPTFADIAEDLLARFEDSTFVAHNVNFDYGFLKEEFRRLGWVFNTDRLCTVRLSRNLYKQHKHHNLTALIERHGFQINNRHRAFDDAKVLWDFMQLIQAEHEPAIINRAIQNSLTKTRGTIKLRQTPSELIYEDETGHVL